MRISDWSSDVCSSDLFLIEFGVAFIGGDGDGFLVSHIVRKDSDRVAMVDRILGGLLLGDDGADAHPVAQAQVFERQHRSEEHTSELQSLMRISYAVFCLKKKKI